MKKTLSLLLALCLTAALLCGTVGAQAAETENEAVFAARAMGIMTGDQNGSMNLGSNVTRAEFAKMMVCASQYKDSVGTNVGVSLYKDVKSDHWASQYIRIAVEEGWFQGYVDGSFRPSGAITVEEGATVALRVLGYTAQDLMGAFPAAQLSKYSSLGLSDGISKTQGQPLSRQDCAQLFYNLMGTKNKAGQYYGTTLGYTVTNGKVNYSDLVNSNMKGPYLAEAGGNGLLLAYPSIIKDGKSISKSQINKYDVYYYNAGMNTVWVYDSKAIGTISSVSPNSAAPTKVTIGGTSYNLATSDAMFAVSDLGGYKSGDTVSLLLDRNGDAAFVVGAESTSAVLYGVVLSTEKQAITVDGSAKTVYSVKVVCADGTERSVNVDYFGGLEGSAVSIKYVKGVATITAERAGSLSGTFTSSSFGGKKLAENVKILDVCGTKYTTVSPARLSGYAIPDSAVLFYSLNGAGEIENLILGNATGDAADYALITNVKEVSQEFVMAGQYTYLLNGAEKTMVTESGILNVTTGGARVVYKNGAISTFKAITSTSASSITQLQAVTSKGNYHFADNVQTYLYKNNGYEPTTVSAVLDSSKYSYTVWVDSDSPAGNRVRILIAQEY